jgi:hypothetical protein
VREKAELEPLSRKLVIGSPQSMICESAQGSNLLRPVRLSFSAHQTSVSNSHYTTYHLIHRSILWTANPNRIYNWYSAAQSLIDDSTLDYLPHISFESETVSVWKTNSPEFTHLASPTFQHLDNQHVAIADGDVLVNDPNFVPLLNLDIPFLESASLDNIHQIMRDHPDELSSFRNFLFKNIDKIKDKNLDSATFGSDLQVINREIDDNIRKLRSDLARSRLKHYIDLTGGIAAAFTLSVICLSQHDTHTLAVVGPGGFLYVLSSKISDYLSARLSLRDCPVYFLWLLGPSKRL